MLGRGHVAVPVEVTARWQDTAAVIAWQESEEAESDHYELSAMAGEVYESEDEVVLERVSPEGPMRVGTTFGLDEAGATVVVRVYVVLRSGHERGSVPMVVVRGRRVFSLKCSVLSEGGLSIIHQSPFTS